MCSPCVSPMFLIRLTGTADPPTTRLRIFERSYLSGSASSVCRSPCQIVGTPADTVTPSCAKASSRLGGSRKGPGNTIFGPAIAAA